MIELRLHWGITGASFNILQTSKTDFYKSAQVGGFSQEVEEGERREREDINLRLSHPAPTIWEDREIETGLRSDYIDNLADRKGGRNLFLQNFSVPRRIFYLNCTFI